MEDGSRRKGAASDTSEKGMPTCSLDQLDNVTGMIYDARGFGHLIRMVGIGLTHDWSFKKSGRKRLKDF